MKLHFGIGRLSLAMLSLSSIMLGQAQSAGGAKPAQMSLRLAEQTEGSPRDVLVEITVKNIPAGEISILETTPYTEYSFTLRNESGAVVPLSEQGRKLANNPMLERIFPRVLKPEQQDTCRADLRKLFDITSAGKYSLVVERRIFIGAVGRGGILVASNALPLNLTP